MLDQRSHRLRGRNTKMSNISRKSVVRGSSKTTPKQPALKKAAINKIARKVENKIHSKPNHPKPKYAKAMKMPNLINIPPRFASANVTRDNVVIEEANEVFQYVNGTAGFENTGYYINPGNALLFPVFSNIAQCYTNFKLISLEIAYLTEGYQIATGASAGNVFCAINYNPQVPQFDDVGQMQQFNPRLETVPFESGTLRAQKIGGGNLAGHVDDKPYKVFVSDNLAVPTGTASSVDDYNVGLLQVATNKNAVTTEIGKFRVMAKFAMWGLHEPHPGLKSPAVHAQAITVTGSLFPILTVVSGSTSKFVVSTALANVLSITHLDFDSIIKITCNVTTSGGNCTASAGATVTGGTLLNYFNGDTVSVLVAGSGTGSYNTQVIFRSTTSSPNVTFSSPTISAGTCLTDIWVEILPSNLVGASPISLIDAKLAQMRAMEERIRKLCVSIPDYSDDIIDSDFDERKCESESIRRYPSAASTPLGEIPTNTPLLKRQ